MAKIGRPDLRAQVLEAMPGTRAMLAKKSGVSTSTVGKWLAILRAEKAIHIGGWRRAKNGGSKQPLFVLGQGQDARPPKTLTPEQSQQRYRKRHPSRRKEIGARSYRQVKLREKGHGFLAALFL